MHRLDRRGRFKIETGQSSLGITLVERVLGLALLLVLTMGSILVLRPFLTALMLAVIVCVSTWPLFLKVEGILAGRRTAAALVMALIVACFLVVPLIFLGNNLVDNVIRLSDAVRLALDRGIPPPGWLGRIPFVGNESVRIWNDALQQGAGLGPAVAPYVAPLRDWALGQGRELLSGTLQVVLSIFLSFFLYRDGAFAKDRLERGMERVGGWRAKHVLEVTGATISSVANGVLGTALIQAILLGVSLRFAGVPGAFILGALGLVLTLVPMGLVLIWLPVTLWLLSRGDTTWAIFIAVWNGVFVGSLDNVLRPYLISRGVRMPMVLIFLGVMGGLVTFGLLGVFLGPVLLAVTYTLIQDWERARAAEI